LAISSFNSSARESYAARRSQNSVSPPRSGSTTADSIEYFAQAAGTSCRCAELVGEIADGFRVRAPGDLAVDADVGDVDQLGAHEPVRAAVGLRQPEQCRADN